MSQHHTCAGTARLESRKRLDAVLQGHRRVSAKTIARGFTRIRQIDRRVALTCSLKPDCIFDLFVENTRWCACVPLRWTLAKELVRSDRLASFKAERQMVFMKLLETRRNRKEALSASQSSIAIHQVLRKRGAGRALSRSLKAQLSRENESARHGLRRVTDLPKGFLKSGG